MKYGEMTVWPLAFLIAPLEGVVTSSFGHFTLGIFWKGGWMGARTGLDALGKVKITLEQAMKAQRGSRGIALLFL
jgi:hypothetical protein